MLFYIRVSGCTSFTSEERATDGYMLSIYLFGALLEFWLTFRNPFK